MRGEGVYTANAVEWSTLAISPLAAVPLAWVLEQDQWLESLPHLWQEAS